MSKALTISEVQETYPDAFAKIKATIKDYHDNYLEQYNQKYGFEPPDLLLNLHLKFYATNGSLVAIEPRGGLLHWNPDTSVWLTKGNITTN